MGSGEENMSHGMSRIRVTRFFEPEDRCIEARLQQMHNPNPPIPVGDLAVSGAEANGLLHKRDYFLYGPGLQLAVGESEQRPC